MVAFTLDALCVYSKSSNGPAGAFIVEWLRGGLGKSTASIEASFSGSSKHWLSGITIKKNHMGKIWGFCWPLNIPPYVR